LTGGLLLAKGTSYAGDTVGTLRSVSSPSFLDTSFLEVPQGDWSASGVPNGEAPFADAMNHAAEAPTAQIRDVDPRQLVSRQGPDEMDQDAVRVLRQDMEEYGYDTTYPIDAAEVDGQLIIQDGHHRVQAAISAQIPEIPVRVNPVTSAQATKLGQEATQVLFGNPWEW
jgi:hypothetical protein